MAQLIDYTIDSYSYRRDKGVTEIIGSGKAVLLDGTDTTEVTYTVSTLGPSKLSFHFDVPAGEQVQIDPDDIQEIDEELREHRETLRGLN